MHSPLFLATCVVALVFPTATRGTATDPETATVIQYTYDESGNRIRRAVKDSETNPLGIASLPDSTHAPVAVANPNPTAGIVTVELVGGENPMADGISLFSLEGSPIKNWGAFSQSLQIDLSPYPSGWYVLFVNTKESAGRIKILKL